MNLKEVGFIGYGADLRSDDGVGFYVVRELEKKHEFRDCGFFYGFNALDLIPLFEKYKVLYLIDSGLIKEDYGKFIKAKFEDIDFSDDITFTHDTNFKQLIPLAKDMGYEIPQIYFYLIKPKILEIGETLSPEIQKGAQEVIKDITLDLFKNK
jgi:hydrogenase maturation protease